MYIIQFRLSCNVQPLSRFISFFSIAEQFIRFIAEADARIQAGHI